MTETKKSAPAKAPRAAAKTFSPRAARQLATERQKIANEIAQLSPLVDAKEAECARLKRAVDENEGAVFNRRAEEDETLAPLLAAAQKELDVLCEQWNKLQAAGRELADSMPLMAEDALRAMYPPAVQTKEELARLGEIEARLQAEKFAIERDCDPSDDAKLKELEGKTLRLSVIPGKRDRWIEKLDAQTTELAPFFEAATHAFSRALTAQREQERARLVAALNPFFEDGKVPAIVENDITSLLRETAAFGRLDRIENDGRGFSPDRGFHLSLVPPLLAGFDALAALEEAP